MSSSLVSCASQRHRDGGGWQYASPWQRSATNEVMYGSKSTASGRVTQRVLERSSVRRIVGCHDGPSFPEDPAGREGEPEPWMGG